MRLCIIATVCLGGCLLTETPEAGFIDTGDCSDAQCPDLMGCADGHGCAEYCIGDWECKFGARCAAGACVPTCQLLDCGDYDCNPITAECHDTCVDSDDCHNDTFCCTPAYAARGDCEERHVDTCIE